MQKWTRRLLAMLLAVLLASAALVPLAQAEDDWRTKLRDAFGLAEETTTPPDQKTPTPKNTKAPKTSKAPDPKDPQWALPITEPQRIVNYLHTFGRLPDNFITKNEARDLGWDSSWNYVGDVAPGMSIGGDRFGNYEGQLPEDWDRTWYECDTNYKGKKRNAKRLLYSSDGLYYYTDDHYKTFTQMFPEE